MPDSLLIVASDKYGDTVAYREWATLAEDFMHMWPEKCTEEHLAQLEAMPDTDRGIYTADRIPTQDTDSAIYRCISTEDYFRVLADWTPEGIASAEQITGTEGRHWYVWIIEYHGIDCQTRSNEAFVASVPTEEDYSGDTWCYTFQEGRVFDSPAAAEAAIKQAYKVRETDRLRGIVPQVYSSFDIKAK